MESSRELVDSCVKLLNEYQQVETGGNSAVYPTLVIFLGTQSIPYLKYLKNTLEDNWNNAKYIKYISITIEDTKFICTDVIDNRKLGEFDQGFRECIVGMLGTDERIFLNRNRVKLECILNSNETDIEKYYQLFHDIKTNIINEMRKTLYLMISKTTTEEQKKTDKLRSILIEDWKTNGIKETIYLLSNQLKSGQFLLEDKIWQNYRLVADIILLGGNKQGSDITNTAAVAVYNGVKTVAYALVTKPVPDISIITIHSMMEKVYEIEKNKYENINMLSIRRTDNIITKLKIKTDSIELLDIIFNAEIKNKLPISRELSYLPYNSETALKRIQKYGPVNWEEMDHYTEQVWSLYYEKNFTKVLQIIMQDEEKVQKWIQQFIALCHKQLSLFEIINGLGDEGVKETIENIDPQEYHSNDESSALYRSAITRLYREFYSLMIPKLITAINAIVKDACEFNNTYVTLMKEVANEKIDSNKDEEDLKRFYREEVRKFVETKGVKYSDKIFNEENTYHELMTYIYEMFESLIKESEIFKYSFEKELEMRMNNLNATARMLMVNQELNDNIQNCARLNCIYNYFGQKRGTFYLVNSSAAYAQELMKADKTNFRIFDLNRTDCIEKIEIYDLEKLNEVTL